MKPSHWVQIAAVVGSATLLAETSLVPGASANRAANITAPLSFEPNQGQTDASVKFVSRGKGYTLFLTSTEAVLALWKPGSHRSVLRMKLSGGNSDAAVNGFEELAGKSNYFIGNDPTKWRTGIPNYSRVKYSQVYPGVDLVFYGNPGELEYDFVVAPGADPSLPLLAFDCDLEIDENGDLLLAGGVRLRRPSVYQDTGGRRRSVAASWLPRGRRQAGFEVGAYDFSKPLVIDPVLIYSTYFGRGAESGRGIAVDTSGSVYVIGDTGSPDFPTMNPLQPAPADYADMFVAKFNPAGSALVYSTYLGGTLEDFGRAIAVDSSGSVYLTGETRSTDFPTRGALQSTYADGGDDAFVVKLNPSGSALVYSTYFGGTGMDIGNGIAVDASGSAHIVGVTMSTDLVTANAFQPLNDAGYETAFVAKLNADGTGLVYSTYMGHFGQSHANAVAVDPQGNAYVTGTTNAEYPTTLNAFQKELRGGWDVVVSKFSPVGAVVYSTYVGGYSTDTGYGIAVDYLGNAYVAGGTLSSDFPTANAAQPVCAGGECGDAFILKLNPTGSELLYSTFVGGSLSDEATGIAVDASGNACAAGSTSSADFPVAAALQPGWGGDEDAFVACLSPIGASFLYSTYLGGSEWDHASSIAIDVFGNAYVTGATGSGQFPTANPLQAEPASPGAHAFVSKVSINQSHLPHFTSGGGVVSAVVVANPSRAETARVVVSLFDDSGLPLAVSLNGQAKTSTTFLTIPPLGSVTLTTDGTGAPVSGSVRVTSTIPVTAAVRIADQTRGAPGIVESAPLASLAIPVLRDAARGFNTGLALANTQARDAGLAFSLRGLDGREVSGGSVSDRLPPNGHWLRFIDQLFPGANTANFQGTMLVTATTPAARVSGATIQMGSGAGEFTALPVVAFDPAPAAMPVAFAHFATGPDSTSSFFLLNPSSSQTVGELAFYDDDGNPLPLSFGGQAASPRAAFTLPPQGGLFLTPDSGASLVAGSARVTPNRVGAVLRLASPALGLAGEAAGPAAPSLLIQVVRSASRNWSTTLSVASTGPAITLNLSLFTASGEPVAGGQATVQLRANGRISSPLEQLFPNSGLQEFEGTLTAVAEGGSLVAAAFLTGSMPGEITALPVVPLR